MEGDFSVKEGQMQSPTCRKRLSCLRERKEKLKWPESSTPVVECCKFGEIEKNCITLRFCKQ